MSETEQLSLDAEVRREVARRRTFAIISHPDSGKTTLTEKLLLYSGAIREAGEVKAKANRKKTVSDWMELEQQRGISVSSSVLQLDYRELRINLLDTPGHKDFSEDTYRTLMAADLALMLMDAGKGVEIQTRKLFEVCKMRGLPVMSFFNKMDRDGRDPFELLQEVERELGITAIPVTWPIGAGSRFRGVYHRLDKVFHFFEAGAKPGQKALQESVSCSPEDSILLDYIDEEEQAKLVEDVELLDGVFGEITKEEFISGKISPTLYGSARTNFGVPIFLDLFDRMAPAPQEKDASPSPVSPDEPRFSAFVFKIQANMDKAHRDRMAFLRICSGKFERDMDVSHARLGKKIRLTHSKAFLAQDRSTVDHAYAGDIVGIHDPGHFKIGDTLYTGPKVEFSGIPQFSPECFAKIELRDPLKRKQLQKGIEQLCEEGLVQLFVDPKVGMQDPVLGVVGVLQFDVMVFRLKDEYGVEARLQRLPYGLARWVKFTDPTVVIDQLDLRVPLLRDGEGQPVALFKSEWEVNYTRQNAPKSLEWYPTSHEAR